MTHAIVGTAGHIDHGKTALVKALTGEDTDRLKEEKARGISIDLGFAEIRLADGTHAGVVDVPGHERFIRNMLAGAHAIDLVLFVVAADDGVMPQTEEHLEILHLLGVRGGIVVVTKADLVNAERLREVRDEIEILTVDTVLEGAPVLTVSSLTGAGIEELRAAIQQRLAAATPRELGGAFRLPVDRAFLMKGHGVVVTGSAVAGEIGVGDAVRVLPGGEETHVRSVQVHGLDVKRGFRGQRIALNLAGVERTTVARGHVIVHPSIVETTRRLDARVEIRPLAKKPLPTRRRVRVHIGTAEVMAKLVLLGGKREIAPREGAFAQLLCDEPIVAFRGDRFILRSESAERTLGGGTVVHPFAPPHRASDAGIPSLLERVAEPDTAATVIALLSMERRFDCAPSWLAHAAGASEAAVRSAAKHPEIEPLPGGGNVEALTLKSRFAAWRDALIEAIAEHHRAHPLLPGMEMELLRTQLPYAVSAKLFRAIVDRLGREKRLVREESLVRLPNHRVKLAADDRAATETIAKMLAAGGYTPPDVKQIAEAAKLSPKRALELLGNLEREGKVAKVSEDLYYHADALARLREMITARIQSTGPFGAADFRDMIAASRKYSIALLEFFDRTSFTIRVGDLRKLRRG